MSISKYDNIDHIKLFKSIADEMRLRIIRILLNGSFHVNEILFIVNGKQSNISHHLKILQESMLVISKKEGSLIYYRINELLNPKSIINILEFIKQEEKNILYYNEDFKRMEAILLKRKKNAEEFFNNIGKNLDYVQSKLFQNTYSVDEVVELFENRLDSILDLGCGTGRNLPILAKYADKVLGFDSSPTMLQLSEHICKKNNLNYELKLGDMQALPFKSSSISGVFINMVMHHVSDPLSALKEIARVSCNKGKLLLIELLAHQNELLREKYADLWLGFTENELDNWLDQAGFNIIKKDIKKSDKEDIKQEKLNVIIILAEKYSKFSSLEIDL